MPEKLKKPTKTTRKPYYNYLDVTHYLEQVHGKNFRDYAGKWGKDADKDTPYQDFWHWHLDKLDQVTNGCFIYMPEGYEDDPETAPWIKEILGYYREFLGEDYYEELWLSW